MGAGGLPTLMEGVAFSGHQAPELLVKGVGLTPADAISIVTRNSAEALGKTASFVVLNANPLDDITNTRRIDDLYLHGHRVDRDMIQRTNLPGVVSTSTGGGE